MQTQVGSTFTTEIRNGVMQLNGRVMSSERFQVGNSCFPDERSKPGLRQSVSCNPLALDCKRAMDLRLQKVMTATRAATTDYCTVYVFCRYLAPS
jgi:hypothetical protein